MNPKKTPNPTTRGPALAAGLIALGMLAQPGLAAAQSAIIYGSVSNFDISNDTGKVCHGFEVDLDGATDVLPDTAHFNANRYGMPHSFLYSGGVAVRWESPVDPATQALTERTIQHTVPWFPGQCYQWNPATYQDAGCEHFGTARAGTGMANITSVSARWLCEDASDPSGLVPQDPPTAVPYANYFVQPPAQAGNPPQVVAEIQAPEPAPVEAP